MNTSRRPRGPPLAANRGKDNLQACLSHIQGKACKGTSVPIGTASASSVCETAPFYTPRHGQS